MQVYVCHQTAHDFAVLLSSARDPIMKDRPPLTQRLDDCIDQIAAYNGTLHAMITALPEAARGEAAQQEARQGQGALAGVIMSVKDNIDTAGIRTTRGSKWFADLLPNHDATVVAQLRRSGAILIGKDNLHEFAFGGTSQNPHHGACRNPWNTEAIPGGSSGGAGASVAAGFSEVALGTDTGGSVRIPAALNGVSTLRPTVGRVSNYGTMPVSAAFDTVGPLARRLRDVATVYEAIAGYDARDPRSVNRPVESWAGLHASGLAGVNIGTPWALTEAEAIPEVVTLIRAAMRVLTELGAINKDVRIGNFEQTHVAMQTCAQADAAAVHWDRFDQDPSMFGADVERRLRLGRAISGATYSAAISQQPAWKRQISEIFSDVDLLAMPTVGFPAPLVSESPDMIAATHRLTRLCTPWSFAELPAVSVPCGFVDGLPIGLQLVGPQWSEARLLATGIAFQEVTDHHGRTPTFIADRTKL
jgi:aspartyl-tRNA(Asn)/glutamyl-tRNA(Gln) amidotransferase subunit A